MHRTTIKAVITSVWCDHCDTLPQSAPDQSRCLASRVAWTKARTTSGTATAIVLVVADMTRALYCCCMKGNTDVRGGGASIATSVGGGVAIVASARPQPPSPAVAPDGQTSVGRACRRWSGVLTAPPAASIRDNRVAPPLSGHRCSRTAAQLPGSRAKPLATPRRQPRAVPEPLLPPPHPRLLTVAVTTQPRRTLQQLPCHCICCCVHHCHGVLLPSVSSSCGHLDLLQEPSRWTDGWNGDGPLCCLQGPHQWRAHPPPLPVVASPPRPAVTRRACTGAPEQTTLPVAAQLTVSIMLPSL